MTLIVWLTSKIVKNANESKYWIGILVSSIIFAIAHFPVLFQAIDNPSTTLMICYLIGTSIRGIIFGWLYWKKGLESAFIAHIFSHIIIVIGEPFIS